MVQFLQNWFLKGQTKEEQIQGKEDKNPEFTLKGKSKLSEDIQTIIQEGFNKNDEPKMKTNWSKKSLWNSTKINKMPWIQSLQNCVQKWSREKTF